MLVSAIRAALREAADPERAPAMQAYMKSAMPYLGVSVPHVRRLTRAAARQQPPADLDELEQAARTLWDGAEFREERYAATGLTGLLLAKGRLELMPLHEHMTVSPTCTTPTPSRQPMSYAGGARPTTCGSAGSRSSASSGAATASTPPCSPT
jgi:hypothetical protein